jgi:drug/metabolite transporter (DMT)-like permease
MFSTSVSVLLRKTIVDKIHPIQFEVTSNVLHLLMSLVAYWALGVRYHALSTGVASITLLQTMASFVTVVAFTYAIRSGNGLGSSVAIMSASPMVTLVLSMIFLGEKFEPKTLLGILFILTGTLIVSSR